MDRTHADLEALLAATSLPRAIRDRILEVAGAPGLLPAERVDVVRELIAHFEDGITSGLSASRLLADFGDGSQAARLVVAGKKAARPARNGGGWLPQLGRDVRYATRRLRQSPAFSLVAILSLALGIGANTAIFSVVKTLLLSEPPVERPDEVVHVYESSDDFPHNVLSYPDYLDVRDASGSVFSDVAALKLSIAPVERGADVDTVVVELVTGNYFDVLGVGAAIGRTLAPDDDVEPRGHPVVMLAHGYWQREFAGDPTVVGAELRITGQPYTVIGVVDESYKGGITGVQPSLYVPVAMLDAIEGTNGNSLEIRRNYSYFGRARLQPGATVEQAREALAALAGDLRGTYPDAWTADREFLLVPASDVVIFPAYDDALRLAGWLLLAVVGLVLLIACANLASFLLARAVDRRKEIAVRLSLGAGRGQLVRQLLTEAVVLSAIGGAAGVGLAYWLLFTLENSELPLPLPMAFEFGIDGPVLGFALVVSLLAGLLFGLVPALQATRADLVSTLRDEASGGGGGARARLRNGLVIAQVAVSVVLLVSAGLFLRSLGAVMDIDPGIGSKPGAIANFSLPANVYPDDAAAVAAIDELENALLSRPEITAVGVVGNLALEPANNRGLRFNVDGVEPPPGLEHHYAELVPTTPGFFEAAGVRVVQGRAIDETDSAETRPVAVVSSQLAQTFWPGQSALGRTLRSETGDMLEVVGVAADIKMRSIVEAPRPVVYRSIHQFPETFGFLVAASTTTGDAALRATFETFRDRAPGAVVVRLLTMEEHLSAARFPARVTAWLFGVFGALALGLAAIGLYGTVSYSQSQRVREVGIRMSLGADTLAVLRMLLGGGLRLVAIGVGLGLAVALVLSRVLAGLLYNVEAWDPATFVGVVAVLAIVAVTAAWIPARRATRIDPVTALRSE